MVSAALVLCIRCLSSSTANCIRVSFWRLDEVAARTGSYAEAGAELGLTHGAVSRQIAAVESWLGQRLFVRTGRRMTATPAARVFAAEVSLSFDRVIAAAEACGRLDARRILRVSAPTTFAMRWLIPRLDRFHTSDPRSRWRSPRR
jgi:LysR family glycine cleavage system transcriptional activator